MNRTVYCSCFYCEHHEGGKCLSPVLHLGHHDCCQEFTPSEEKLEAYLKAHANDPNRPTEYGEYDLPNIAFHIRQK